MDLVTPAPSTGPLAPRLSPDSHLVLAARDLLARHSGDAVENWCQRCDVSYPCPPAVHAAQVCRAAGIDPAEPRALPEELAA